MSNNEKNSGSSTEFITKEAEPLKISAIRLAILSIIKQYQNEGIYGYQIGDKLSQVTEGELIGKQAGFYAILRRYVNDGLLETELKPSDSYRPSRKYYYLSSKGERVFNALWQNWIHYYGIVERLIENK